MMNQYSQEEEELIKLTKAIFNTWGSRKPDPRNSIESLVAFCHEKFTGFGSAIHEVFDELNQFAKSELQGIEQFPAPMIPDLLWVRATVVGNTGITRSMLNARVLIDDKYVEVNNLRYTFCFTQINGEWKWIHFNASMPYGDEYLPVDELKARNQELERKIAEKTEELIKEKEKTENLLHNVLPVEVAKELLETGSVKPARFEEASILFTDFKEFTNIVATIPTRKLISELNELFSKFDDIMESEGIEKIKTIGDAYLAVSGLPAEAPDHAKRCVRAGKQMIDFLNRRNETSAIKWKIRIGIHSGPIAAGVVGKKKFAYDIFGDTINIASRIETAGEEGKINVSAYTYDLIKDQFPCEYRGKINAKGKGDLDMYFVK